MDGTNLEICPGSYEVSEVAQMIKRETYDNVILEADKNTLKCKTHVTQSAHIYDLDKSISSLRVLKKQVYHVGNYTSSCIFVDIMALITNKVHSMIISGIKHHGNNSSGNYKNSILLN